MDFFGYFQIIALILFYCLFVGRTLQLMGRGIKVFVLGKGKKGFTRFVEFSGLLQIVWVN